MEIKTGTTRVTRRLDEMTTVIKTMEEIRTLGLMEVATPTRDQTLVLMVLPDTENLRDLTAIFYILQIYG